MDVLSPRPFGKFTGYYGVASALMSSTCSSPHSVVSGGAVPPTILELQRHQDPSQHPQFRPLHTSPPVPTTNPQDLASSNKSPPSRVLKRAASQTSSTEESPAKKQSKWKKNKIADAPVFQLHPCTAEFGSSHGFAPTNAIPNQLPPTPPPPQQYQQPPNTPPRPTHSHHQRPGIDLSFPQLQFGAEIDRSRNSPSSREVSWSVTTMAMQPPATTTTNGSDEVWFLEFRRADGTTSSWETLDPGTEGA